MSKRPEQVASTLQRALREVLARGLSDPRISGLVTVTDVVVSDDLANATVRVSVLPQERESLTLHGLRDAAPHIRRKVGDLVAMKRVPALLFKTDEAARKQSEVYQALGQVNAEREARTSSEAGPSAVKEEGKA